MKTKAIKELKRGEYFRLSDSETAQIWVRDGYVHGLGRFSTSLYYGISR